MLCLSSHGRIESDIAPSFVHECLTAATTVECVATLLCMATNFYELHAPPTYSYERAYPAFSAQVQLQMLSGQLPTHVMLYKHCMAHSPKCRWGCGSYWETVHHIFVSCPHTSKLGTNAHMPPWSQKWSPSFSKFLHWTGRTFVFWLASFLMMMPPYGPYNSRNISLAKFSRLTLYCVTTAV